MVNEVENSNKIISSFLAGLDIFVFIANKKGYITYANSCFKSKFPDIVSVHQLEHYFSFDICVIQEEEIMSYAPLKAAFVSEENFFASVKFEEKRHKFRQVIIKSFDLNDEKLFMISYEDIDKKSAELDKLKKEIDNLRAASEENQVLKQKAEVQSVKTALINRVSSAIRDTLDLDLIIKKALSETVRTLGISGVAFFEVNERVPKYKYKYKEVFDFSHFSKKIVVENQRLIVPVIYVSNVLGYVVASFAGTSREWQQDEIDLVENIASQLAVSINQASLFSEIAKQKEELKSALEQLQEAQVQLVHSEKMASLGQLVAGIAHEINTPLGAINSNNDMIKRCLDKFDPELQATNVLKGIMPVNEDAISRINALVRSLKNFARLDEADLQDADLIEGIESTLDMIRHETKNRITITKNFADIPKVLCHPNGINQVLMNILVNACQAIENEGVISLSTWCKDNYVFIKIADTGNGIAKENLSKVFDPGFTTKGVGVGTGLGLSISYKIIKEHKGDIVVTSEFGNGATFIISLPVK